MAYRELELTLLSARDLKSVNMFTRMDVYAVASISGDPMTRQCTPTDTTGGRNPSWNATMRFSVPPSAASATASGGGWLHVLLRSQRALGDRDVGEVVIPLAELLAGADATGAQPPKLASYQVHTVLRGEPRGVLNVSYRLGPVVAPVAEMIDDDDGGGSVYSAATTTTTTVGYPAPQQPFIKPQNTVAPPHQQYQYLPQHDAYASAPFKQPQNPAAAAAVAAQQAYYDSYHRYPDAYYEPQKSFSRPQTPQQQPYQYHDAYASPAQPFKHQNPVSTPPLQQPYNKPQNPAAPPPQQTYQYSPQYDSYYAPTQQQQQQPSKPQETPPPTPKQQPYQYPDTYLTRQQSSKTQTQQQTPASPPPQKPSHHPPPALQKPYYSAFEEAAASSLSSPAASGNGGYGPTNYFLGPHTQIILGGSAAAPTPTTPPPPARSNSFPAKTDDGPAKPKPPSYTPVVQPTNPSPAKADQAWPKPSSSSPPPLPPQQQQEHHHHQNTTTPARPNASSPTKMQADNSTTPPKHHDTKTATADHAQAQTKLSKLPSGKPDHSPSSWPKASSSPQHTTQQQGTPIWPNAASPKKPEGSTTTQPSQHDIRRVVEHVKTLTKVASGKHDHAPAPRPIEALEEQKSTQISVTKPDGTQVSVVTTTNGTAQVGGDYGRALSGKADSTTKLPREGYYANTRSNSTPAKAEHHQPGNKAIQQIERVHSLSTTAAR